MLPGMRATRTTISVGLTRSTPQPAEEAGAEPGEVLRAAWAVLEQLAPLLPRALGAEERRRCGAFLGRGAAARVRAVLRAVAADPALFADDAIAAAALRERQARAAAYRHLGALLLELAERAQDGYLREQAGAAEEAQRLVRRLRHAAAAPDDAPAPALHRKALLLGEALARRPGGRPRRR